jgi:hypothetical protein
MVGFGGLKAYFKLTADTYVNDVNAVDWTTGTVNEGYEPTEWFASTKADGKYYNGLSGLLAFEGTIDGDGHSIHGLYYEYGNTYTSVGFIPYAQNVTIKDLGIENSFIGCGRFTGGFVGYMNENNTASVSVDNCFLADSCAVIGWDAGAAYVTKDSDIHTNDGAGLCSGAIDHYTYKEDAAGTYKYDAETDKYVAIAEGEEYDGTRYAIDDIVWAWAGFTSEAVGGIVGRLGSTTVDSITNCIVSCSVTTIALKIFGSNDQGVTWANPGEVGDSCGHVGSLWGDDWNANVTANNCFSIGVPHEHNAGTNLYTLAEGYNDGRVSINVATDSEGLSQMPTADNSAWYAVKGEGNYIKTRAYGTRIGDVNEDGVFDFATDYPALRGVLINNVEFSNGDKNGDGKVNICDLVAFAK